ncbi:hypothetical protein CAEBREN_11539 [Caenorhabditis brenneri]|uniref:Uncharacterized protein n=1 Tax=Caenorhabditis brenneri TaxID=135651 RepID=G0N8G9_CAEBE|nr:hypothetical protein CAEBREN_11539 [Caenorhabditis brenneri]
MSVRDKYRSTFNELQRAESIPEKISVFRRAWAWVIVASQKALARFGLIVIPIYLIVLSLWTFNDCGDIPVFLFSIGIGIFVCTLYPPFYAYGKKKALEDRQDRINHQLEPLHQGELSTEEVNKFIPLRMHRICNMAFTFVLTMAPLLTYHTFSMFSSRDQCNVLTFWTSFVLSIIYSFWILILLSGCFLCCFCISVPHLMEKFNRNSERDVEAGNS